MRLICIGDSLTFGYGVHLSQRWTQLCAQETGWELVNEGINGDTTGGMLARMQGGVLAELREGGLGADRPYVLLMGGSNDVFYSGSDAAARENMGAMGSTQKSNLWALMPATVQIFGIIFLLTML